MGRRRYLPVLLALAGLGGLLAALFLSLPAGSTLAQPQSFDCREVERPDRWYACSFANHTGGEVNDIHVVFRDGARLVNHPPVKRCARIVREFPLPRGFETTVDCQLKEPLPDGGSLEIQLIVSLQVEERPARVISWHWTLDGTPRFNPTETPTPPDDTPTPTPPR